MHAVISLISISHLFELTFKSLVCHRNARKWCYCFIFLVKFLDSRFLKNSMGHRYRFLRSMLFWSLFGSLFEYLCKI